jgi:hypothetical protein
MKNDSADASMTGEWIAIQLTALKTSRALSAELPDSEKILVPSGAHLSALLVGEDGNHWVIREASIDGLPVFNGVRYIFKNHWDSKDADKHIASNVVRQEGSISAFADYAVTQAKHRRLYAAFRRRLAR